MDFARTIGLGGYFLVTGVTHTISDAGFEVNVNALHQAMRDSDETTVGIGPIIDTGEPNVEDLIDGMRSAGEEAQKDVLSATEREEPAATNAPVATGDTEAEEPAGDDATNDFFSGTGLDPTGFEADCEDPNVHCEEYEGTFGSQEWADSSQRKDVERRLAALEEKGCPGCPSPGEQLMYEKYLEQLETGEF